LPAPAGIHRGRSDLGRSIVDAARRARRYRSGRLFQLLGIAAGALEALDVDSGLLTLCRALACVGGRLRRPRAATGRQWSRCPAFYNLPEGGDTVVARRACGPLLDMRIWMSMAPAAPDRAIASKFFRARLQLLQSRLSRT